MARNTIVYWHGILGIPGKGPNWSETYNPDRTIGSIIQTLTDHKLNANGKRIEILKCNGYGRIDKINPSDPHWNHNTKLSEYLNTMGLHGQDIMLVYANY